MFLHSVYFRLREDLTDDDLQIFMDGVNSLTTIDSVRHGYVGTPAETNRPIIDKSYTHALLVIFDDRGGHDAYQVHPTHDAFRDTCASFWADVKIYDVDTTGPAREAG